MSAREWWKTLHRLRRVVRREAAKAADDLIIFGTGVVRINEKGEAQHVPFSTISTGHPSAASKKLQVEQVSDECFAREKLQVARKKGCNKWQ